MAVFLRIALCLAAYGPFVDPPSPPDANIFRVRIAVAVVCL